MSRLLSTALLCLLLASTSAFAQALSFQVDTATSHVYIRVDSATSLGHQHGVRGNLASGSLTFAGKGSLTFDMTSFVADAPESRQYVGLDPKFSASDAKTVTTNMQSSSCLDVARYPQAVFAITSLSPLDNQGAGEPGRYRVSGQFTLHGVTQDVSYDANLHKTNREGVYRLRGSFSILQTSYGIKPYSAIAGFVRVADRLQIWGDLFLVPAQK